MTRLQTRMIASMSCETKSTVRPLAPELGDLLQTALLKRLIADGENLVGEQDLRVHVDRHRERQPQIHAARVVPQRAADELLDFGELEDVLDAALRLGARNAEDRRVHQDVVVRGQIGIEPGAELQQRHDAADADHAAGGRRDHPRQDLEQRRLAGAVGTDDAQDRAGLDAEPDVAKRPEVARLRGDARSRRAGTSAAATTSATTSPRIHGSGCSTSPGPRRPDYPWIIKSFILQAPASPYRMSLSIAFAQLNPTVGDVAGNLARVRRARDRAAELGADLVVFSELVLVGYPPEDLVLRPALVDAAASALRELERETAAGSPALLVTLPWRADGCLHNAAALVADGRSELRFKHELPNYGVFDEKRLFNPGPLPAPISFRGVRLGIPICEDIWFPAVTAHLARAGAEILLVPNGSPFEVDKFEERIELARARTSESGVPLAYVNQVGGQDELVFDGGSFVMNADGTLAHLLPFWREAIVVTKWEKAARRLPVRWRGDWDEPPRLDTIYRAMMLGLRDYVRKNGFRGIVLGLSGGIDSALTAAVAVDALGADRVRGVRLPSRFTSQPSMDDAADSAARLGIKLETMAIGQAVEAAEAALAPASADAIATSPKRTCRHACAACC